MKRTVAYKRRPSLAKWMQKHMVSTNVCSLSTGVTLAVEETEKRKLNKSC